MRSREFGQRLLPAAASDLRSLIESYSYPIVVCDEDGCIRFCNRSAQQYLKGVEVAGEPIPNEWMDGEELEVQGSGESDCLVLRLRWDEIVWEGNLCWCLVTYPAEGAEAEQLKLRLEQSMETAAVESEKRKQVEGDRERLEMKLRDLHQRSIAKLDGAREALEKEKAERQALLQRLDQLKSESDQLKLELEEKSIQVEEVKHRSAEMFEALRSELAAKDSSISQSEEKAERYRKFYQELDGEVGRTQEENALLAAKLRATESRLNRAQKLLDGVSVSALEGATDDASTAELKASQARIKELETTLQNARKEALEAPWGARSSHRTATLEAECKRLRQELSEARSTSIPVSSKQIQSVMTELRLHNQQELVEARIALGKLQDLYQSLKYAGVGGKDEKQLGELKASLIGLRDRVLELEAALARSEAKVRELENEVQAIDDLKKGSRGREKELEGQILRLQMMLKQAEDGSGSDESKAAGQRIAELEAQLAEAQARGGPFEVPGLFEGADWHAERAQLQSDLAQLKMKLGETTSELSRTKEGDRETKKLAYADQLTGLANFNLTNQYLQVCFDRCGRGEGAMALIVIDLDNFRRINEAMGQKAGDELLRQVGGRLERIVVEKDTAIARRGEDEFIVVAFLDGAGVDSEALAARIRGLANNILGELAKPFEVFFQTVHTTASMGVALYPGPARNGSVLLEQAESAMYRAKETGRARINFYTREIHQARERKVRLEKELREAVAAGQFTVYYQPVIEVGSKKIVGLEALLRWSHPLRGILEPAEFLSIADESGLILPLSEQVLGEALSIVGQKFMNKRFLSFNLSHRQLVDAGFASRFMKHLQRNQVKPSEIMVEVSEKAAGVDPSRTRQTLASLTQWGVGIALDDFGHGACDLSIFREFAIQLVKIDGSLVRRVIIDKEAAKLCLAIVKMATALEIPVLAEGVESREQLEVVAEFGCKFAQGRFLYEPMNITQLQQVW